MRAFKLISITLALFSGKIWAQNEDVDEDGNPIMPQNPYGDLTLEDIVRTGTLDGVNPPSTPEEIEVFEKMKGFFEYQEASKQIDDSFADLMADLNMDDLTLKMKELQGQMEGEFLANEMAKLDISLEEMPGLTEEQ